MEERPPSGPGPTPGPGTGYDPALARALLSRTAPLLEAWLPGLPVEWLDAREGPGSWSPREVVAHMADLEREGWMGRVQHILEHGADRPLPGIDREGFRERFAHVPVDEVVASFRAARERNLAALEELEADGTALGREGEHPVLGRVRLSELLATWVVHDQTHLAQIARTLAAQYREAVGPWAAFLSVLGDREGEPPS